MPEEVRDKDGKRDRGHGRVLQPGLDQAHSIAALAKAEEPLDSDAVCVVFVFELLFLLA